MGTAAAARGAQKLHVSTPRAGASIATGTSTEIFYDLEHLTTAKSIRAEINLHIPLEKRNLLYHS